MHKPTTILVTTLYIHTYSYVRKLHFVFLELEYEKEVIPSGINILENYHPGAVVRILACNSHSKNANRPGEVR